MKHFVVSKHPQHYLKQGLSHCGAFSVQGILSAYGKDIYGNPKDYHPTILGKVTGKTLGTHYWEHVLRKYDVEASTKDAGNLSPDARIDLLKQLLDRDTPVMVLIGNGYNSKGTYNAVRAKIVSHWITLWGYNDAETAFYVYDSCVPRELHKENIPVGNTIRTYDEIVRDWRNPLLSFIPGTCIYIEVSQG